MPAAYFWAEVIDVISIHMQADATPRDGLCKAHHKTIFNLSLFSCSHETHVNVYPGHPLYPG